MFVLHNLTPLSRLVLAQALSCVGLNTSLSSFTSGRTDNLRWILEIIFLSFSFSPQPVPVVPVLIKIQTVQRLKRFSIPRVYEGELDSLLRLLLLVFNWIEIIRNSLAVILKIIFFKNFFVVIMDLAPFFGPEWVDLLPRSCVFRFSTIIKIINLQYKLCPVI